MAKGDPLQSPWVWQARDNEGDIISITVTFDNATRNITGISSFRDAACIYTQVLIGLGADGSPDSTDRAISVPSGTRSLTPAQLTVLANRGLVTIENMLALQITAQR
jgi:hypothetical protein